MLPWRWSEDIEKKRRKQHPEFDGHPLVITKYLLNMAIEIVDLRMKHGDFPQLCKRLPEGNHDLY